jgi:hypothetical protein
MILILTPLIHWLYSRIFGFPPLVKKWDEIFKANYSTAYNLIIIIIYIFLGIGLWGIYKKNKIGMIFAAICFGFMWIILIIRMASLLYT